MKKLFALLLCAVLNLFASGGFAADRPDFLADADFEL